MSVLSLDFHSRRLIPPVSKVDFQGRKALHIYCFPSAADPGAWLCTLGCSFFPAFMKLSRPIASTWLDPFPPTQNQDIRNSPHSSTRNHRINPSSKMMAKDSSEADARDGAGHPASVDEVPTFTTRQHLEYLVGLIIDGWKKTMVKWDNVSGDAVTPTQFDELAFFNPNEKSLVKFRVGKVPDAIHHKVDALKHMQRIGLPHLPALVELVKEELAKDSLANDSDESGDGDETSFTGMVSPNLLGRLLCYHLISVRISVARRACQEQIICTIRRQKGDGI